MYLTIGVWIAIFVVSIYHILAVVRWLLDLGNTRDEWPAISFLLMPTMLFIITWLAYPLVFAIIATMIVLYHTNDKAKEEIKKIWEGN